MLDILRCFPAVCSGRASPSARQHWRGSDAGSSDDGDDDGPASPLRHDRVVRVVVVGDRGCGKTSIVSRYVNGVSSRRYEPTVGPELTGCAMPARLLDLLSSRPRHPIRLQFVELPQCEMQRETPRLLDDADCALVVADATQPRSVGVADRWLLRLRRYGRPGLPLALLINKSDLQRRVATTSGGLVKYAAEAGLVRAAWSTVSKPSSVQNPLDALIARVLYRALMLAQSGMRSVQRSFAFPPSVARSAAALACLPAAPADAGSVLSGPRPDAALASHPPRRDSQFSGVSVARPAAPTTSSEGAVVPPPVDNDVVILRCDDDGLVACAQEVTAWSHACAQSVGDYLRPYRRLTAMKDRHGGSSQLYNQVRFEAAAGLDVEAQKEQERLQMRLRRVAAHLRQLSLQQQQARQSASGSARAAVVAPGLDTMSSVRDAAADQEFTRVVTHFSYHMVPSWAVLLKQLRLEEMLSQARGAGKAGRGLVLHEEITGLHRTAVVAPPACLASVARKLRGLREPTDAAGGEPHLRTGVSPLLMPGSSGGSDAGPLNTAGSSMFGASAASSAHAGCAAPHTSFAEDPTAQSPAADGWDASAPDRRVSVVSLGASAEQSSFLQTLPAAHRSNRDEAVSRGAPALTWHGDASVSRHDDLDFMRVASADMKWDLQLLRERLVRANQGKERTARSPQLHPRAPQGTGLAVRMRLDLHSQRLTRAVRRPPDSARSDSRTPRFLEPSLPRD
eukprot:TRINITY_DN5732_c0_g1_i1.p1 TRINITY_DN5732_c0_g1~~TRINITY_DN5732_c0_g1_i1.p1  ORF type:complete len:736 (+),score=138.66 TRINITY_DN5732_c0_g1_i1:69-2276(+)